jgi:Tfp pilus assembly protein PilX
MNRNSSFLNDQSGAALVIALLMMVVLTLIGLASTFTSTFEIKLSGNKRGSTNAFYSADSGAQVVLSNVENFNLPGKYDVNNKYHYSLESGILNPTNADIVIYHDTTQSGSPRGMGFSATGNFEFVHYDVESKGQDQVELSPIKSTTTVQQKVVRLVPTLQGGN